MINRTKHQLKSNMVLTSLGPDHCDLHILEHPSEDKQTESEETGLVIKTEGSDDSLLVDQDIKVKNEDDSSNMCDFVQEKLEYEISLFQCTFCLEEFVHEHAYMQHMNMHLQNDEGEYGTSQECKPHKAVSSSSSHSSLITENKQADPGPCARAATTLVAPLPANLATNNEIKVTLTEEAGTNVVCRYRRLTDCFVKLNDIFTKKVVPRQDGLLVETSKTVWSCVNPNIALKDIERENKVPKTEYIHPVTNEDKVTVSNTLYICDFCQKMFKQKSLLVRHIQSHTSLKSFACKVCRNKCRCKSLFNDHTRTHTGEKPFTCNLCNYKCALNGSLVWHMRAHTGEKPFTCKLCSYKCITNSSLVRHMKTHTGENPYFCTICDYRCVSNSKLLLHMGTHTGIKPFSCKLCSYKCTRNCSLVLHMRTHTGIKPYTCKFCNYKSAESGNLVRHMRTHTGKKPFTCELCNYKSALSCTLVRHMRTHTGIKPYTCKYCNYKSAENGNLVRHMRSHTGEKRHHCKLCDYKCDSNSRLMRHMKIHTGGKPSSYL
ncbi:gastrula zinc finger protein XlCGF57.1-like isoform X2 [Maniola jurtina]|nr:gastrula zinc finger protein XlCGF57.1-like isoform X2 [Maniola jurtina]